MNASSRECFKENKKYSGLDVRRFNVSLGMPVRGREMHFSKDEGKEQEASS